MRGVFGRERDFRHYRRLGLPRPLPWRWWRYAEPVTKRQYFRLGLRILIPLGLILVVVALLPLSPKESTTNFVLGIIAFVLLIVMLIMALLSLRELARVSEQIYAEVQAKKAKP